ncbi:MAG TPA: hypothetical protein VHM64_02445 [Candidatus Binatia bacterium]|nr:hypothetical protein [Candidatus Binatia bacterium]
MLSINNNLFLPSQHREHAWALRTVGQDLADLRPEYLEIEFTGGFYVIRGRARTPGAPSSRPAKMLGALRGRHKRQGSAGESPWFERKYSLYDINRLDETGVMQRKDGVISPDIYVLAERLRTVGRMIESKDGQLVKVTLDNTRIAFTFRDVDGELYNDELSGPELYRSQQDGNRSRGTGRTRDPWSIYAPRCGVRTTPSAEGRFRLMSDSTPKPTRSEKEDERSLK